MLRECICICICKGCVHSLRKSGNHRKCPYCNSDRVGKTDEEMVEEILRVEANDAVAMGMLGSYYYHYHGGELGLQQDHNKAIELWTRAADLGCSKAHISLSDEYEYSDLGDMRKAKFHLEAAAMAGHEGARNDIGHLDLNFYSSIIRIELLSIGSLLHLLGHILPCITCFQTWSC